MAFRENLKKEPEAKEPRSIVGEAEPKTAIRRPPGQFQNSVSSERRPLHLLQSSVRACLYARIRSSAVNRVA
jgi:hypothetical protein